MSSGGNHGVGLKTIGAIAAMIVALIGTNVTNYKLSIGASDETAQDIKLVVQQMMDEDKSTMTMDEAEVWRAEQDRIDFVDNSIDEYGEQISNLEKDVQQVQTTVTINQVQNQEMKNILEQIVEKLEEEQ